MTNQRKEFFNYTHWTLRLVQINRQRSVFLDSKECRAAHKERRLAHRFGAVYGILVLRGSKRHAEALDLPDVDRRVESPSTRELPEIQSISTAVIQTPCVK